uniref:Acyl-CoA ligase AFT1-1 ) n=1 Tax=Ganoderma boninense TaxID=34458 RepID=A0A5K1K7N3_9APHY|nr:Acyl-CoA ligase AFT1-1 (EC (AF-toxin biosynthesis protein 1-1) [Ganoderma boninense]
MVKPFCAFLMWIGVYPQSLLCRVAAAAAEAIRKILVQDCFPEVEVAFFRISPRRNGHAAEKAIALGGGDYSRAITAMLSAISDLAGSIDTWNDNFARFPELAECSEEDEDMAGTRQEDARGPSVRGEEEDREDERTAQRRRQVWETTQPQRAIRFVVHVEPIAVSYEPRRFTRNWALIELYEEKIAWGSFKGKNLLSNNYLQLVHDPSVASTG